VERHAAPAFFGFELRFEAGVVDVVDRCLQEAEVHAADEVGVLSREFVKRTVPQDNRAAVDGPGFEAVFFEHVEDDPASARSTARFGAT
jgi:hypothetical protein